MDRIIKKVKMGTDMKWIGFIRNLLMAVTAALYLFLNFQGPASGFFIVLCANILLLLFEFVCLIAGKTNLLTYRKFWLLEIAVTGSYLFFPGAAWLAGFSFALAINFAIDEGNETHTFLYILMFYSFSAMGAGSLWRKDFVQLLFLLPHFFLFILLSRSLEDAVRRKRKDYSYLKQLVDNKNKLLSTLTHELRTPLSVIKTSNELVLEERPGPINDTQRSLLRSSLENTVRLTSLVENILSQVKVEFAWFSMKKKLIDIRPLIRKVALDMKPYLETKEQSIRYNYPGILSKTMADSRWIQQVLLNLIHNGSKNSPKGSELEVSVKENEQCIVVSVLDCGSGIADREIPRVFKEFYQSEDPSKDPSDGAGLGLTIVRDVLAKHGGEVYISSMEGKGTVVSFTLPVYKGVFSEKFDTRN